jgi:hypothetical protein
MSVTVPSAGETMRPEPGGGERRGFRKKATRKIPSARTGTAGMSQTWLESWARVVSAMRRPPEMEKTSEISRHAHSRVRRWRSARRRCSGWRPGADCGIAEPLLSKGVDRSSGLR